MPYATACHEIDKAVAQHLQPNGALHILLMGGEPFLEFELIKQLVAYVQTKYTGYPILFKAVTNGTLVHHEIQNWIVGHQDIFRVELSLDGIEANQNKYRSNSFGSIDVPFFTQKLSNPVVSTVIIPETLESLADNIIFLTELGFKVKAVTADGADWTINRHTETLAQQLMLLMEYYLKHPQAYPFNLLSLATYCVTGDDHLPKCKPGIHSNSVSTEGKTYACHRCSSFYNNGKWEIPAQDIDLTGIEFLNEACISCCVRDICNTCPASIASVRNNRIQSEMSCRLSKLFFYANALFHLRLLTECPEHIFFSKRDANQRKKMLLGARTILKDLNPDIPF